MRRSRFALLAGVFGVALAVIVTPSGGQPTTPATEPSAQAGSSTKSPEPSPKGAQRPAAKVSQLPLGLPAVPIPADNPMTPEKIELGKLLYFDKRVSKDGTISCATCHDPNVAWTEHRATSAGIEDQDGHAQIGGRNSPTVINAAYARAQFWDGREPSLEAQAVGPVGNPIEMGNSMEAVVAQFSKIPGYQERFQQVFGTGVTEEGFAKAIAAFERTVLSGNSPYDRFMAGDKEALSEAQQRGLERFNETCADCHAPPLFSNYRYYNAGVGMDRDEPDKGRMAVTGKPRDLGKFRVPALREVANTGPYFHDGSVKKLEDAVALMAGGGKDNPNLSSWMEAVGETELTEADQKDIVEFLEALSGDYPKIEPPKEFPE